MKQDTLINKFNNKLRDRSGETISETLVALLVSALALVMLAGAIATASRIITTSRTKLKSYYDKNNAMVEMNDSTKTLDITFSSGSDTVTVKDVPYEDNTEFSNHPVVTYRLK